MKQSILFPFFFCTIIVFAQDKNDAFESDKNSLLKQEITAIQQRIDMQVDTTNEQNKRIVTLQQKLKTQEAIINLLNSSLSTLSVKSDNQEKIIDSLKMQSQTNSSNIKKIAGYLETKIQQTEITATNGIAQLGKDVNQNKLYWIIATLATLLLGGLIYWLLGKRIKTSKTDVETQIINTQKTLEEESIKLDNKLVEVLEVQLKLKNEAKALEKEPEEKDHSLALKVADEIIRIQKNLQQMDSNTRGLRQLSASVKRIQDNFASNGYEIVEMIGMEYKEGMKVSPNFIPSEDLEAGKQIITRIIKPQVNYKNKMIQAAQIEVSVGG